MDSAASSAKGREHQTPKLIYTSKSASGLALRIEGLHFNWVSAYPQKRTFRGAIKMSAKGQKRIIDSSSYCGDKKLWHHGEVTSLSKSALQHGRAPHQFVRYLVRDFLGHSRQWFRSSRADVPLYRAWSIFVGPR